MLYCRHFSGRPEPWTIHGTVQEGRTVTMKPLANASPQWLEEHYLLWRADPDSLPPEWRSFFSGFELGALPADGVRQPETASKLSAVAALIHRHRDLGHLLACTDPLSPCSLEHPLLDLTAFGLAPEDLDTPFPTPDLPFSRGTLREIVAALRETYCRSIGVEFMHIQDQDAWRWLVERMETTRNRAVLAAEDRVRIFQRLQQATLFEEFLHRKFPGQTRFSLEGGETLVPMLDAALAGAARNGATDVIVGMAHRGRLNVQAHVFGKPYGNIFAEFTETSEPGFIGDGDVKYHGGYSSDVTLPSGDRLHLTLVANPSHLEAVDPVAEGKSRARQDRRGEAGPKRVLPVLIHGDAAFAGQGIVSETLNMSNLEGYKTGGTLHIVVNNQIGFTTLPADARSSRYATDVAKLLAAPIFHVHCEDPEAAIHAVQLAVDFRYRFARDVVVELICYRRYGHNEGDEPYFTQPLMYDKIKHRPPIHEMYASLLLQDGIAADPEGNLREEAANILESALKNGAGTAEAVFSGRWSSVQREYSEAKIETGVSRQELVTLARTISRFPDSFIPHPKVAALITRRIGAVKAGTAIDWANAESLAFASLLHEGTSIRLSGQDCRRGTFSQRHCVLHDMQTEATHVPLAAACAGNTTFRPYDSLLSEAAVLGFEYGYSLESPESLTIWEAQYGDFANGAQVITDQFITSGETKWGRATGLVLLLPHGYEGQGAEHSSARVERFLQLCAGNNMVVAFPSTPAQYFHLLRRQVRQPFRRPLVALTPKSLLRNPLCVSQLDEFSGGWFREILPASADPEDVATVLICTGKIFFELLERTQREGRRDMAIVRVEQLYPLRSDLLRDELGKYRKARKIAWVQEEPRNMGVWAHIRPYLAEILGTDPRYVGRRESPCPATGSHRQHKMEQERLLEEACA